MLLLHNQEHVESFLMTVTLERESVNCTKILTSSEASILFNTQIDQIPTLVHKKIGNWVTDQQTLFWKCQRE